MCRPVSVRLCGTYGRTAQSFEKWGYVALVTNEHNFLSCSVLILNKCPITRITSVSRECCHNLLYRLYSIMRGDFYSGNRGKTRWKDKQFLWTGTSHWIEAVSPVEMKRAVRIALRSSVFQPWHENHYRPDVHQHSRQNFSDFRPMLIHKSCVVFL